MEDCVAGTGRENLIIAGWCGDVGNDMGEDIGVR